MFIMELSFVGNVLFSVISMSLFMESGYGITFTCNIFSELCKAKRRLQLNLTISNSRPIRYR